MSNRTALSSFSRDSAHLTLLFVFRNSNSRLFIDCTGLIGTTLFPMLVEYPISRAPQISYTIVIWLGDVNNDLKHTNLFHFDTLSVYSVLDNPRNIAVFL